MNQNEELLTSFIDNLLVVPYPFSDEDGKQYLGNFMTTHDIEGYRGGSCWGDKCYPYEIDELDIENSIVESLISLFKPLEEICISDYKECTNIVSEFNKDSYVNQESSGGDYYGNYSKYGLYVFDIKPTIRKLLTEEDFNFFENKLNEEILIKTNQIDNKIYIDRLNNINNQIKNFEINQKNIYNDLLKEEKKLKKELLKYKEKKESFENHKEQTMRWLKEEKEMLEKKLNIKNVKNGLK